MRYRGLYAAGGVSVCPGPPRCPISMGSGLGTGSQGPRGWALLGNFKLGHCRRLRVPTLQVPGKLGVKLRHTGPSESAPATGTALRVTAAARVRGREPARVGYSRSLSRSGLDAPSAVAVAAASRMARFYPRWQCCCTWGWYVVRGNLKIGPVVHGKFLGQTGGLGPEVVTLS